MREAGYSFNEIALALGTSRTTSWRRLKESNMCVSKYSEVSDQALDFVVQQYQVRNPNCGQVCYRPICQVLGSMFNAGGFVLRLAELIPSGSVSGGISRSQDVDTVTLVLITIGI